MEESYLQAKSNSSAMKTIFSCTVNHSGHIPILDQLKSKKFISGHILEF
jgi:hypothetical protein